VVAGSFFNHLNVPDGRANDGDFSKLDKTIKAVLLGLHINSGTIFLDFSKMTLDNQRMYRNALKIMNKVRIVKVTRLNGNTWVVMKGVMPSGVFETSDGDSWIVCLLLAWWVEYERTVSIHNAKMIDRYFETEFKTAVYGDDHTFVVGPHLYFLDEDRFAEYVASHWDMRIRDVRKGLSILSIVRDDKMCVPGVVFLKRYLIERPASMPTNVAPIVPWKSSFGHFNKIPYSDTGFSGWTRIIVSVIGHAWDCMGTNVMAYQELSVLHHLVIAESGVSVAKLPALLEEEMKDERVKTKILKKMGLKMSDFMAFPDLSELHRRHVVKENVSNIVDPNLAFGKEIMGIENFD